MQRVTGATGEDEVVHAGQRSPPRTGPQPVASLLLAQLAQRVQDDGRCDDGASAGVGLRRDQPWRFLRQFLQLLPDGDVTGVQVDVLPRQPEGFTNAQPKRKRGRDQRSEAGRAGRLFRTDKRRRRHRQQRPALVDGQRLNGPTCDTWRVGQCCDVARDQAEADGATERGTQDVTCIPAL